MTVYVLQEMGRNIRSAEKFGELKVCLPDNRQIVLSSGPLAFKLQQELKDFNDNDYLLLMGDPAICLLYTSPSPRDRQKSRMPSSA